MEALQKIAQQWNPSGRTQTILANGCKPGVAPVLGSTDISEEMPRSSGTAWPRSGGCTSRTRPSSSAAASASSTGSSTSAGRTTFTVIGRESRGEHDGSADLMNAGRVGGPCGTGGRCSLTCARQMTGALHDSTLANLPDPMESGRWFSAWRSPRAASRTCWETLQPQAGLGPCRQERGSDRRGRSALGKALP